MLDKIQKLLDEANAKNEHEVAVILGALAGAYCQSPDALEYLANFCFEFSSSRLQAEIIALEKENAELRLEYAKVKIQKRLSFDRGNRITKYM